MPLPDPGWAPLPWDDAQVDHLAAQMRAKAMTAEQRGVGVPEGGHVCLVDPRLMLDALDMLRRQRQTIDRLDQERRDALDYATQLERQLANQAGLS